MEDDDERNYEMDEEESEEEYEDDEIILELHNRSIPMKWIPLTLMKLKLKDPLSI